MSIELQLSAPPTGHASMVIRRPAADVFNAFVDEPTIKRFWVTDSTGPLAPGATVTWMMNPAGAEATVKVRDFEPGTRLGFDWGDDEAMSQVEFQFSNTNDGYCRVDVTEASFDGTGDELTARATDSTGGFTMVLC